MRVSLLLPIALLLHSAVSHAEETPPSHARIDQAVAKGNVAPVAGLANDAAFLRRIYLDLAGNIPSSAEARQFLADDAPDKRTKLISELLESRDFVRHMAATFDVWLMERHRDTHVKNPQWREYLTESLAQNKPYNQLAAEILAADGTDEKNRAASRFYLDRAGEPNQITRDVGRLFFGQDLQCAQCHDHPTITDFLQRDYYGLFAFFNRTYLFQPDKKKPAVLAEKAEGQASYESVFTSAPGESRPRLLGGVEIAEPTFAPGGEYLVKPNPKDKKLKPVPKYSRRAQIAKLATDGGNAAFNRNIANRLWAHMMGRGLVEPFDFHHAANPPAHPQLLDLLADAFVAMKFDVRAFLGELAQTQTYQRAFELPATLTEQARQLEPKLAAWEQEAADLRKNASEAAAAFQMAKKAWESARIEFAPLLTNVRKAETARNQAVAPLRKAEAELVALQSEMEAVRNIVQSLESAARVEPLAAGLKAPLAQARKIEAKLNGSVEAKQKAVAGAEKKLKPLAAALAEQQKLAETGEKPVLEARQRMDDSLARYKSQKFAAKLAAQRHETGVDLVKFGQTAAEAEAARESAGKLTAETAQLRSNADSAQKLATELEEAASQAETARQRLAAASELAQAAGLLRETSLTARTFAETSAERLDARQQEIRAAEKKAGELDGRNQAALDSLTNRWTSTFALAALHPLTPEQLCLSTLQATGFLDRLEAGAHAAFDKKLAAQKAAKDKPPPKPDPKKKDAKPAPPVTEADRESAVETQLNAQVASSIAKFVQLFGGQAGQPQGDFYATADQALFLANDGLVRSWLRPSGENLAARLTKLENPAELADELYLSTLTRYPTAAERAEVANYLAVRGEEKAGAVQELAWALLSSVEFRFKH